MKKKKIILASFSRDSGHYKAAQAIEKAYTHIDKSIHTEYIDSSSYLNSFLNTMISKVYNGLVSKLPFLWGYLYDNKNVVNLSRQLGPLSYNLAKEAKKILQKQLPDAVICTQAFACGLFSYYAKKKQNTKVFAVITDHYINAYWINDNVDGYFVPSEEGADFLKSKGIPNDKIFTVGLPVDPVFGYKKNTDEIKRELKISLNIPVVLVMGGHKGLGHIEKVIRTILGQKTNVQIIAVCGNNKRLYEKLEHFKACSGADNLKLFKTTDRIDELMEVSDILISKPGGITVAEAFSKELPIICLGAIAGQETRNQAYLQKKGSVMVAENEKDLVVTLRKFLNNDLNIDRLLQNICSQKRENSAQEIASIIKDRI